jgi:hypothetical protein
MKNKWRELYNSTRIEMESRTDKFNKSINVFCHILKDIRSVLNDPRVEENHKIEYSNEQI